MEYLGRNLFFGQTFIWFRPYFLKYRRTGNEPPKPLRQYDPVYFAALLRYVFNEFIRPVTVSELHFVLRFVISPVFLDGIGHNFLNQNRTIV